MSEDEQVQAIQQLPTVEKTLYWLPGCERVNVLAARQDLVKTNPCDSIRRFARSVFWLGLAS